MIKLPVFKLPIVRKNIKLMTIAFVFVVTLITGTFVVIRFNRNHIHDLPTITESGRLAVLTDSSSLGFSVKGDSVFGFQYEIIKAFADTLGLELVISEESDLADCMKDLEDGDYDIIASLIPQTSQWKDVVFFTEPLFTTRQMLVQRIDSTQSKLINKQYELGNETIYIPVNSPNKMRLEHLSDEIANPIHVKEIKDKSMEQLVKKVADGSIKYTLCDESSAERLKLQFPNIDASLPIGFAQSQGWAVHKNSPLLLAELNDFLHNFIGSEAYWKIYRKYFN